MGDAGVPSRQLLHARYGQQKRPADLTMNPTIEGLLHHRSVRAYRTDPLPEFALETMVAAAQSASTSSNLQQWSVVAVTDPEIKAKLRWHAAGKVGDANPYINEAPVTLLWVVDLSRSNKLSADAGKATPVHEYLDSFITGSVDVALAAQNATVAAESMGLGICYLGSMRNQAKEVAELVKLPQWSFVAFGCTVGWPDTSSQPTSIRPRLAQSHVLHYNQYDVAASNADFGPYEGAHQSFRREQDMKEKIWTETVVQSSSDMGYMDGREDFSQTVRERGFRLI